MSAQTSHGVILEDAVVNILIGPAWDGSAPIFTGTPDTYMARIRSMSYKASVESVSVKGGQMDEQNRYHTRKKLITLQGVVCANGFALRGQIEVGYWMQVTSKPASTFSTPIVVFGVITEFEWTMNQGSPQMEQVTIDTNATYTGS